MSREPNDRLTRAGNGQPAGEVLRRYRQPAAIVQELDGERGAAMDDHVAVQGDGMAGTGRVRDENPIPGRRCEAARDVRLSTATRREWRSIVEGWR